MVGRILKWAVFILGGIIIVYNVLYFSWESTKVVRYYGSGAVESAVHIEGDSILVFDQVEASDFVSTVMPFTGDTLVSIGGMGADFRKWNETFNSPHPIGRRVILEFIHRGELYEAVIRSSSPKTWKFLQIVTINILRFLVAMSFVIVGCWAYYHRPESGGVRALALFSFAMSLFLVDSVRVLSARYASFDVPLMGLFQNVLGYLVPYFSGFWLNLQFLFPRPHKFIRIHPVWAYMLCYLPITLFHICYDIFGVRAQVPVFFVISLQVIAGFAILSHSYSKSRDTLERRQMRLVLMGSGFGLSALFVVLAIAVLFNEWLNSWNGSGLLITFCFFALLFSPLSFAYAFQHYRLFEIEAKLRRGTRYFIATAMLLMVFVGVVYLIGELLLRNLGIDSRTPTLIIAMGLAFCFTPAFRIMRTQIEKRFYPEKHRLREKIREFSLRMMSIPDCKTLWREVGLMLQESIGIGDFFPIIRFKDSKGFRLNGSEGELTPFRLGQGLALWAQEERKPILVDEVIAVDCEVLTLEEEAWIISHNIAVLLPMMVRNHLLGFLGLGYKSESEEFPPDEIMILASLASQLALTADNIRLLEENLEKKRMEEELQMARSIQRGFLPTKLPRSKGLEIEAWSKFCLEVAGDYYDVLSGLDDSTIMAVGDVSGKGAGAALLMANLQASIRTAVAITTQLKDIVGRVNDLIYTNTAPDQYITFFVAVFNPVSSELTYVNAGHNYPVLLKPDGSKVYLDKGGLILGCMPGIEYVQDTVEFEFGDLLLMYTDGGTETMNASEEEFGEDRLINFVGANRDKPLKEICRGLEWEIQKFNGGEPLLDDFTLILARRIQD